jgi:ABC-type transport system involved in multi-copper enzyme maturation permease subunit
MNLHLFKFFGNSFASLLQGTSGFAGLIQSLLITGIETSMTFWYSFCISGAYCLVFLSISYAIFQKRDF